MSRGTLLILEIIFGKLTYLPMEICANICSFLTFTDKQILTRPIDTIENVCDQLLIVDKYPRYLLKFENCKNLISPYYLNIDPKLIFELFNDRQTIERYLMSQQKYLFEQDNYSMTSILIQMETKNLRCQLIGDEIIYWTDKIKNPNEEDFLIDQIYKTIGQKEMSIFISSLEKIKFDLLKKNNCDVMITCSTDHYNRLKSMKTIEDLYICMSRTNYLFHYTILSKDNIREKPSETILFTYNQLMCKDQLNTIFSEEINFHIALYLCIFNYLKESIEYLFEIFKQKYFELCENIKFDVQRRTQEKEIYFDSRGINLHKFSEIKGHLTSSNVTSQEIIYWKSKTCDIESCEFCVTDATSDETIEFIIENNLCISKSSIQYIIKRNYHIFNKFIDYSIKNSIPLDVNDLTKSLFGDSNLIRKYRILKNYPFDISRLAELDLSDLLVDLDTLDKMISEVDSDTIRIAKLFIRNYFDYGSKFLIKLKKIFEKHKNKISEIVLYMTSQVAQDLDLFEDLSDQHSTVTLKNF